MIEVPEGAHLDVSTTLVIDGFHVVLRSTGTGATLDGGLARRVVHVTGGGRLTLDKVDLAHGWVKDSSGGCGLAEGAGSELHVIGAHVRDCRSDGDVLSNSGNGNGPRGGSVVEDGGGGGVAAINGAHLEVVDSEIARCSAGNIGGGVLVGRASTAVLVRATLIANHADACGGGLSAILGGAAHITDSTVTLNTLGDPSKYGNQAKYGNSMGAGFIAMSDGVEPAVSQSGSNHARPRRPAPYA